MGSATAYGVFLFFAAVRYENCGQNPQQEGREGDDGVFERVELRGLNGFLPVAGHGLEVDDVAFE